MKLILAEPRFLREPIITISELVNEVRFKFDKDKIELIAMDPANVAMVIFKLLSSAFVEYNIDKEEQISVNLDSLKQILRRAKPSDTLMIELDREKNVLKVQLKGESTRTFRLSLIDIEDKEQKIPDLKFSAKIEMNSLVFNEAIEDMDVISDSVNFIAEPKKFTIQAEGSLSHGNVEIEKTEETSIVLDGKTQVKSKYSIEYLKKIVKASRLTDRVSIYFDKDYPLKIEYKVLDKLQLATILAPRVSEE